MSDLLEHVLREEIVFRAAPALLDELQLADQMCVAKLIMCILLVQEDVLTLQDYS